MRFRDRRWLEECGQLRLDREGIVWLDTGDDLLRVGHVEGVDATIDHAYRSDLRILEYAWADAQWDPREEAQVEYLRAKGAL